MEDIIMIVLVTVVDNTMDVKYNIGYVESVEPDDLGMAKEAAENWLKHAQMSDEEFGAWKVSKDSARYDAVTTSHSYHLTLSLLPNLNPIGLTL